MSDQGVDGPQILARPSLELVVLSISAIASITIVAFVLSLANRGFDLTDESYYVHWIAEPNAYMAGSTHFGFVYHPIYLLVDGSIAVLRQINIAITVLLSGLLGWLILQRVEGPQPSPIDRMRRVVTAAAVGATALGMLNTWLPTPNYNSLALQSILCAIAGVVLLTDGTRVRALIGSLMLSTGGVLLFLAKPPSAVLLALAVILYFAICSRQNWPGLGLSIGFSIVLLLTAMVAIGGSVSSFIDRLSSAVESNGILDANHTLRGSLRIDLPHPSKAVVGAFVLTLLIAVILSFAVSIRNRSGPLLRFGILLSLPISAVAITTAVYGVPEVFGTQLVLLYVAVPIGTTLAALVITGGWRRTSEQRRSWGLVALLVVGPFIYAFGTNNNYWHIGAHAGVLWVMAAVVIIAAVEGRSWGPRLMLAVLASQVMVAFILHVSMTDPYRQDMPIASMATPATLRTSSSTLYVSASYGNYFREIQTVADTNGFRAGTPFIDLTGRTPGAPLALEARPLGTPWLLGFYAGSQAYAERALDHASCLEIGRSWILEEPTGPWHLDPALLERYGRNLRTDYRLAGEIVAPGGQVQRLLVPIESAPVVRGPCSSG